ncbi:MAG: type-F conjugative transfer system pilin assembly protein TrbC [bacterium]
MITRYRKYDKKLIMLALVVAALLSATNSYAGSTNDFINQARLHRDEIIKEALNNTGFLKFKENSLKKTKKMNEYKAAIEAIKNKHQAKSKRETDTEKAIIFVSFSMPSLSLKQVIHDASIYQVPVVIRGLYKNSFRKTIEKIFDLIKENNKGGIAINPRWFKEYDIKAVPAVVVTQKHGTKSDVVYGNIPLKKALSIIVDRGDASSVARNILNRSNK